MKLLITILFALMLGVAPSNDEIKFDSVMCELEPIGNVSYSVVQSGTKYFIQGSNGYKEMISFQNAVDHCCEYGGGCDFPPEPGYARSWYVDWYQKNKY